MITGSNARRSPYFNLVEIDVNGLVHLSGIKKQWREMVVLTSDSIRKAINVINTKGQIVFVVDKDDKLKGTITDRDIRKTIVNDIKVDDNVTCIMNTKPAVINAGTDEEEIYNLLTKHNFFIFQLLIKIINLLTLEI